MKARIVLLTGILLLAGLPVFAALEAYLKIEGVKTGPAKDPAHAGWIEAASFSWGASRLNLASVAGPSAPSAPKHACAEHSEFVIVKLVDAATPKLYESAMTGAPIPSLTLDIASERHMLQNVVVKSVQKTSLNGSPAEQLTFTFQRCATHETVTPGSLVAKDKTWIKGDGSITQGGYTKTSYLKNVQANGIMAIGGAGGSQGAIAMQDFHFNGRNQALVVIARSGNSMLPFIERAFQSKQKIPELTINARSKRNPEKYMQVTLTQVFVSSITGNGGSDQITLNFSPFQGPLTAFQDDWEAR